MQRFDIQKVITYITAIPGMSALVGNRIYWGLPKSSPAGVYLSIQEITENQDEVNARSRVEFRIIANDDKTNWDTMYAIERSITSAIASKGAIDFSGFKVYDVKIESNLFQGYDEKGRKIYIRDYSFHYLN